MPCQGRLECVAEGAADSVQGLRALGPRIQRSFPALSKQTAHSSGGAEATDGALLPQSIVQWYTLHHHLLLLGFNILTDLIYATYATFSHGVVNPF